MRLLKNIALEGHAEKPIAEMRFRPGDRIRRRAHSRNVLKIDGQALELTSGAQTAEEKNAIRFKVLDVKPGWYLLRATWLKQKGANWEPANWVEDDCELIPRKLKHR